MIELMPEAVWLLLFVFCLIDVIVTDQYAIRNVPNKVVWILLIVFLPYIGSIVWLVAGHPWQQNGYARNRVPWRSTATAGFPEYERPYDPRATDDIEDRLRRDQARVDREHQEALRKWEASLAERERKLNEGEA